MKPAGRRRSQGYGVGVGVPFVEVEMDAAAVVVGVLEAGEFAHEVLQTQRTFLGTFDVLKRVGGLAGFDDEDAAHGFVGVAAFVVLGEFGFVFGEAIEPFLTVLLLEPVLVAAAPPFGEVLVGDGFSVEEFGHDGFGFWKRVQPREDGATDLTVFEAAIYFIADGFGEAGDFANSCDHNEFVS